MNQIAGVVLAGGLSRRMGGEDKALCTIGAQPLWAHALWRLHPQVNAVALNANGDRARFDTQVPVLPDQSDDFVGPLGGVLAGMNWAAELGYDWLATVAVDTPFFPENLVARLWQDSVQENASIVLAATGQSTALRRHPTFGLWATHLADDLCAALQDGVRKVVQWTDRHAVAVSYFESRDFEPFFNINTQEDLHRARAEFKARGGI